MLGIKILMVMVLRRFEVELGYEEWDLLKSKTAEGPSMANERIRLYWHTRAMDSLAG